MTFENENLFVSWNTLFSNGWTNPKAHEQRYRTNNVVESWNIITGRHHSNVFFFCFNAERSSSQSFFPTDGTGSLRAGSETKEDLGYVSQDERINNIMNTFDSDSNLEKCLQALRYVNKLDSLKNID